MLGIQLGFKSVLKALKEAGIPMKRGRGRGVLAASPRSLQWVPAVEAYGYLRGTAKAKAKKPAKRLYTRTRAKRAKGK